MSGRRRQFRTRPQRGALRWRGLVPGLFRIVVGLFRWLFTHPRPLLAGVALATLGWLLWGYAQRAELFRITEVTVVPATTTIRAS